MNGSNRYQQLCAQIRTIRKHFLPARFSPTGYYRRADAISARALGFRILSVAEIEHYLEDRCIEIAKTSLLSWKEQKHYSVTLQALTVFMEMKHEKIPKYLSQKAKDQADWDNLVSPVKRITAAVESYIYAVRKENHGIREKNLMSLLIPIGLDLRVLDPAFIYSLDNLGSKRGDAAHTSCSMALKNGVDPKVECTDLQRTLRDLRTLDQALNEILSGVTSTIGA